MIAAIFNALCLGITIGVLICNYLDWKINRKGETRVYHWFTIPLRWRLGGEGWSDLWWKGWLVLSRKNRCLTMGFGWRWGRIPIWWSNVRYFARLKLADRILAYLYLKGCYSCGAVVERSGHTHNCYGEERRRLEQVERERRTLDRSASRQHLTELLTEDERETPQGGPSLFKPRTVKEAPPHG